MVKNSAFVQKMAAHLDLAPDALSVLPVAAGRRRSFPAGQDVIHQGPGTARAYVLLEGWACSYVLLSNGTRQIVSFHVPGDTLGLRSILFQESDHNVEAITKIEVAEIMINDVNDVFAHSPKLATAVLWTVSRDVAMVVANLVRMGRSTATERVAFCLLELGARLGEVGLTYGRGYTCPLTQYQLADALGLSAVHVNRVLRELREVGLVTFQKNHVTFDDYEGLVALADFDEKFLSRTAPNDQWATPRHMPNRGTVNKNVHANWM